MPRGHKEFGAQPHIMAKVVVSNTLMTIFYDPLESVYHSGLEVKSVKTGCAGRERAPTCHARELEEPEGSIEAATEVVEKPWQWPKSEAGSRVCHQMCGYQNGHVHVTYKSFT
ncbi:hypothetical protein ACJRO7_009593 [Eucalyptus globulus]|uniref:Uncharacterized protein n=1 Tax=Eucalyptus globulus TaxID=34317 RepID=A0ABD3LA21_EUCGL